MADINSLAGFSLLYILEHIVGNSVVFTNFKLLELKTGYNLAQKQRFCHKSLMLTHNVTIILKQCLLIPKSCPIYFHCKDIYMGFLHRRNIETTVLLHRLVQNPEHSFKEPMRSYSLKKLQWISKEQFNQFKTKKVF